MVILLHYNENVLMRVHHKHQHKSFCSRVCHHDRFVQVWWDLSVMALSIVRHVSMDIVIKEQVHAFVILDTKVSIVQNAILLISK